MEEKVLEKIFELAEKDMSYTGDPVDCVEIFESNHGNFIVCVMSPVGQELYYLYRPREKRIKLLKDTWNLADERKWHSLEEEG